MTKGGVPVGIYRDHILPRLVDRTCGLAALEPHRRRACAGLDGEVVEVGFGSGLNVPFYPRTVTRVRAVEPADLAWRLAADRVAASAVPVERAGPDGQRLPFADEALDSALVTWSLCTIPDPVAALAEVRRVLRPGGALHFLEHGLAPDEAVRRWQHRLEPLQKRLAGGCHLTREPAVMLEAAGFTLGEVEHFYQPEAPRPMGALSLGVARA
ncbi:class I SAM-dependent methyltransferase [Janibacter alittae]|uniref:Class I SAM-dependent methyltransferase n=1 Tax=Janibacter alittae TaxID=3115209 RepID=A0ABZ2MF52_9MICO